MSFIKGEEALTTTTKEEEEKAPTLADKLDELFIESYIPPGMIHLTRQKVLALFNAELKGYRDELQFRYMQAPEEHLPEVYYAGGLKDALEMLDKRFPEFKREAKKP